MIFLSDGECSKPFDTDIQDLCRSAVRLGYIIFFLHKYITDFAERNPLSFHSISFGKDSSSSSLRGMANLALEIQNSASRNPRTPPSAPSSFHDALHTVRNPLQPP
jgi:hypothetical protein